MDRDWWKTYLDDINVTFKGDRFSNNAHPDRYRTNRITAKCYGNSGAGAIVTAITGGASKIILLGYDCQYTDGKKHWHGDHPSNLGNAAKINLWHKKFESLSNDYPSVEIINASRQTALECFKRISIDEAIKNA